MPKIYVAFQQSGVRKASGSATKLREKLRTFPETVWNIFEYNLKAGVETLITLLEGDINQLGQPTYLESLRVNAQGQARKFDPSKAQV